jgi:hypothetical protein
LVSISIRGGEEKIFVALMPINEKNDKNEKTHLLLIAFTKAAIV